MKINIKKLNADSKVPTYAHAGDAGMDIFSYEDVVIKTGERRKIKTGISMELPLGYVGLVWDKSGLAANHGISNLAGVMDAGYRGEYIVMLINLGTEDFTINKGDKIAQLLIQKVESPDLLEVSELSDSSRGEGGFGSTGRK